ncbi:MotA/TolQ/ExbB proton channel family protein [Tropicimonas sp. TH_r6]|uniref:MotA/TolQ/ExbB proton channel family protein n=1 Tax=Tropicimonas sp. TH_r6 TaxID=3082085 RepID=UPI002952F9C1|nr:MotA/TolQ/ExbB proton channel family protein [Tropicimonas sp. TH_r6]MDV7143082.1 MotA/TolQ/ExbB proton channel family protein [Tropicimonas sp. TH_r6]
MSEIVAMLARGGPIVGLLLVLSVASLALIVVKLLELRGALAGAQTREAALTDWEAGAREEALSKAKSGSGPVDTLLAAAMDGALAGRSRDALETELEWRGNRTLDQLGRYIRTLELVGMIAPLLGLLGTVLGMIEAFQQLALAEGAANASILAGGIWQALLTTAVGLVVAIPAAVAANLLGTRLDRVGVAMEVAIGRLLSLEAR